MKYKVGDRVRIRKDLVLGQVYGGCSFVEGMQKLAGEIVYIAEVNEWRGDYRIKQYGLYWTDEMFENDVDTEVQGMNKRLVINVDGNKVVARCGDKNGVARCHPDDAFDFYVGAKLALERLEEAEKPYAWLKEGMRYYAPTVTAYNDDSLYSVYMYGNDDLDKRNMEHGIVFQTKEEAIECAKKMLAVVKKGETNNGRK